MVSTSRVSGAGRLSRQELRKFVECTTTQSSLPRNVDRSMFGHGVAEVSPRQSGVNAAHMELSEQFLSGTGMDRSDEVVSWMEGLKSDSARFINGRIDDLIEEELRASMYRTAVSFLVDKIFQELRWFAFEFNKVASGSSLQIASSILGDVNEVLRMNSKREAEATTSYFRARLSNRHYSLVIRGSGKLIEYYIVPVAQVMALSSIETEHIPVAVMEVRVREEGVSWRLRGSDSKPGTVEAFAMKLFSMFVEVSRVALDRLEGELAE